MLLNRLAVASLLGGNPEQGLRLGEDLHSRATAPDHEDGYFASIGAMPSARGYEELGRHAEAVPWRRERLACMRNASDDVIEHHVPRARLVLMFARAGMLVEAERAFAAKQEAGGPFDGFRFSAAVVLARGLDGDSRADESIALLIGERAEPCYAPATVERFDAWIQRLSENSDAQ